MIELDVSENYMMKRKSEIEQEWKTKYCGANDIAVNHEAYAYTDVDWLTEWR